MKPAPQNPYTMTKIKIFSTGFFKTWHKINNLFQTIVDVLIEIDKKSSFI